MADRWAKIDTHYSADEAEALRARQAEEMALPELEAKVIRTMSSGEELRHEGKCLIVLGPSASGKSRLIGGGHEEVAVPCGALHIDGSFMRDCSETWQSVKDKAHGLGLDGFSNYFKEFAKPPFDVLKDKLLSDAMKQRTNLVIPETASDFNRLTSISDQLRDAGYDTQVIAVVASKATCEARGKSREKDEGKKFSSTNWAKSVKAVVKLQRHLDERGGVSKVLVFDNEAEHIKLITIDDLLAMPEVGDEAPAGGAKTSGSSGSDIHAWCESRSVAAQYLRPGGEVVKVTLNDYAAEVGVVSLEPPLHDGFTCLFAVKTSTFHASGTSSSPTALGPELARFRHIPMRIEWVESSPFGGEVWEWQGKIPGHSLSTVLKEDAKLLAALKEGSADGNPIDFSAEPFRPLTPEEWTAALEACNVAGPQGAPSKEAPTAVFVMSPSAGGKTSVAATFASQFGIDHARSVHVDGAVFRDVHRQYAGVIEHGKANGGLWHCSWPSVKAIVKKAKKDIIAAAIKNKQDMMISETGSDSKESTKLMQKLKDVGYIVCVLGVFADPEEILKRGVAREVSEGKRYNRDLDKLRSTFDSFAPAIRLANGAYKIVRNSQGQEPCVQLEGTGNNGGMLTPGVEDTLVALTTEVPKESLSPADLHYIMEGNVNMVMGYHGSNPKWHGCVLRGRKTDNCSLIDDTAFNQNVSRQIFQEYVDPGTTISLPAETIAAIDEAMFNRRPPERQSRRLDRTVQHMSGRILGLRADNLMTSPIHGVPVVTIELKPKCGFIERPGMPSRYRMLQEQKLAKGKIKVISMYDPVDLLSADSSRVLRALKGAVEEPQNNFRIFMGGDVHHKCDNPDHVQDGLAARPLFHEGLIETQGREAVLSEMEKALECAGLPSLDPLLTMTASYLAEESLPSVLRRVQAWAGGETAPIAEKLYDLLQEHAPDAEVEHVNSYEESIDGFLDDPCDESGIAAAVSAMDAVLAQAAKASAEDWAVGGRMRKEARKRVCRFLLGRTAHDVSVLVNFAHVTVDTLTPDLVASLERSRFKPLTMNGLPLPWAGLWVRSTIVDTDKKPAKKLPEYAAQLDDFQKAYLARGASASGPKTPARSDVGGPVGGHENAVILEQGLTWKLVQEKPGKSDTTHSRGDAEALFLERVTQEQIPVLCDFAPRFEAVREREGKRYIVMANLLDGLKEPAVVDIKIGKQTWEPGATPEKVESQMKKAKKSTSWTHGLRVVGGVFREEPGGEWQKIGHKYGVEGKSEADLVSMVGSFLRTPALRSQTLARIKELIVWFKQQRQFAFKGSSLLIAYDTVSLPDPKDLRFGMIDFAHVHECEADGDQNYLFGLETLARLIEAV